MKLSTPSRLYSPIVIFCRFHTDFLAKCTIILAAYGTNWAYFTSWVLFVAMAIPRMTSSRTILKKGGGKLSPSFKPEFVLKLCQLLLDVANNQFHNLYQFRWNFKTEHSFAQCVTIYIGVTPVEVAKICWTSTNILSIVQTPILLRIIDQL